MRFIFFALFILIHGCGCVGFAQVPQPNVSKVFEFIDSKDNYVKNPIARLNDKNITCVNATAVQSTSAGNKLKGYASWTIDASALNGYCEFSLDAIRDPHGSNNIQMEFMGFIKGDGSLYKAQILDGSSNVKIQTNVFGNNSDWRPFSAGYPGQASPKVRITQTEAGTAPAIQVGVYYGPATNIGLYTPPTTFSAKISNTGVVTDQTPSGSSTISSVSISDTSLFQVNFAGLTSSPNCTVSPVGAAIDGTYDVKISTNATASSISVRSYYADASTNFLKVAFAFNIECTKTGADAPQAVVRVENLDYAPRPYTPTITGVGTPSAVSCTEGRQGAYNQIDCKFTAGTTNSSTVSITLPYGRVATSSIPFNFVVGAWIVTPQSTAVDKQVVAAAGSNLIYPTLNVGSSDNFSPATGLTFGSSGFVMSITARVPIQGWDSNANGTMVLPNLIPIVASYSVSSNQSVTNSSGVLNFGNKIVDTHNAFSGNTFTAPEDGMYQYSLEGFFDSKAWAAVIEASVIVNAAGVESSVAGVITPTAFTGPIYLPSANRTVPLRKGQTIIFLMYSSSATASVITANTRNHFSITRVGLYP